jgi:transcriptional regulator with XRE-family HTH domain
VKLFNFGKNPMAGQLVNLHVGMQLRRRRMMLGLSQEALGNGVGVAAQQVQKYEKGANVMSAVRMFEFAEFLRVPVAYFYEGLQVQQKNKASGPGFAEDSEIFSNELDGASDRETLEVLKSFKRIKDRTLRKRIADLLRIMSLKDI